MNGRSAQFLSSEMAQEYPEIIFLEEWPVRAECVLFLKPGMILLESCLIVSKGVGGGTDFNLEMIQKLGDPFVFRVQC